MWEYRIEKQQVRGAVGYVLSVCPNSSLEPRMIGFYKTLGLAKRSLMEYLLKHQ